jgi:hypothetical protein
LIVAAVAAVAIVITTRMQLFRAKQLDEVQTQLLKTKEAQLTSDLKDKDVKIAEANERANQAALELAKFKAPRALSAEQMGQIATLAIEDERKVSQKQWVIFDFRSMPIDGEG